MTNEAEREKNKNRVIEGDKKHKQYKENRIQTAKYNMFTFIPYNLYDQFSKMANLYFLVIAFLQTFEEFSNSDGKPVILLPLMTIILISGLKDLFEDLKRHRMQNQENSRQVDTILNGVLSKQKWESLYVGQIPADLLLLHSSDKKGLCYVETKSLDGETNLKTKQTNKLLLQKIKSIEQCIESAKLLQLEYDNPNPNLYDFQGILTMQEQKQRVDMNNVLLRGTCLKNTESIVGLVVYSGHHTKIMLNSVDQKTKMSRMDCKMNDYILVIFLIQNVLCLFCGIVSTLWHEENQNHVFYLQYMSFKYINTQPRQFIKHILMRFGNWILLFTNFVPISLLVTLEMIKFGQGIVIQQDKKMNQELNTIVNSSSLNEELGQLDIIFSDKTGTLTANQMQFRSIYVNNMNYGEIQDYNSLGESVILAQQRDQDFNKNNKCPANINNFVNFYSQNIQEIMSNPEHPQYTKLRQSLIILAVANELVVEEIDDPLIQEKYNGASTDELALAYFAKQLGIQLKGSDENDNIIIYDKNLNKQFLYKQMQLIEFSSKRKKMSVVVKCEDKYVLFSKGADSMMFKSSKKTDNKEEQQYQDNLRMMVQYYSECGLRTLVIGQKSIDQAEFDIWKQNYDKLMNQYDQNVDLNRQKEQLEMEIESGLELLAVTGIEDKLQDDVDRTIQIIKDNGIKFWILTGDKTETAINIGYSSNLISPFQQVLNLEMENEEQFEQMYKQLVQKGKQYRNELCVIMNGPILDILDSKQILKLFKECYKQQSLVISRCTPTQKQQVVQYVQKIKPKATSLAIGDGLNDVNMIIQANVGVGIIGLEGQQAARSSDYAINSFQCLQRLIFVHGREAYRRNSYAIFYNFYKNILLVGPQLWFGGMSGFSGTFIYDTWIYQLYNITFTSVPIVLYALLDYQTKKSDLLKSSSYYQQGPQNLLFNQNMFWMYFMKGFLHALLIVTVVIMFIDQSKVNLYLDNEHQLEYYGDQGILVLGMQVFGIVIFIANLQILTFQYSVCKLRVMMLSGSFLSYFVFLQIFGLRQNFECFHYIYKVASPPNYYFGMLILMVPCFLIDLGIQNYLGIDRYRFKGSVGKGERAICIWIWRLTNLGLQ